MQAQGQARFVRSSCCRVATPTCICLTILVVLAVILAALGLFACVLIITGDFMVAAVCAMFYFWLGTVASVAYGMCTDFRSAPPETTRRRHVIGVSENALRADFEQVCPAKTAAEERGVQEGVVNAEDEPCIICLEGQEAKQPCRFLFCKHSYHIQCIDEWWLRKRDRSLRCPMCRQGQPMKTFVPI
mmetsp:Transcript_72587/g.204673  ORF Transcript_72587/g.204673 Transcript_72587/m.204673 type:complete len:187 (-) Transcript_72587:98-658(-)